MKFVNRVLKASEVEVSGTYSLATGSSSSATSPGTTSTQGPAQARIVEQHPQYALLEITCACGNTMQVKCDYSQAMATS
jgi:hypothetical protein